MTDAERITSLERHVERLERIIVQLAEGRLRFGTEAYVSYYELLDEDKARKGKH